MITKEELILRTKDFIKRNHTDNPFSEEEWLWYTIENNLTEEEQLMLIYKLYFDDLEDATEVLFGFSKHKLGGQITRIKNKIKKIWEQ